MNTSYQKLLVTLCCIAISTFNSLFAGITVSFSVRSIANNHFSFVASSTSSDGPVKFYWDFGDGNTQDWSTAVIANHSFMATGNYSVKLVGENVLGERDSVVTNILARRYSLDLNADFSYAPAVIYLGDTVHFHNTSVSTSGTATARWWNFGDGTYASEGDDQDVIYRAPGIYEISLTVNNQWHSDTTIKKIHVLAPDAPLKADFFFSPSPLYKGTQTKFTSIAYTASGSINSWKWQFGNDPVVSSLQSPVYTFTDTGSILVKLTVTNTSGQADSITKTIVVNPLQQQTMYSCPNATTDLYAAYTATTYQWQESTDSGLTYHNLANNSYFWEVSRFHLMVINPPTTWYGYKYRCVTNIGIGTEYKLEFKNTYITATGGNWETAAAWSCGVVPDANMDVVISSGTVTVNSNAVCRSLTVLPGAGIVVSPGFNLTVLH